MADFDLEQLKTLFENLGDRLERTKGDQLTAGELAKMRAIMSAMSRRMEQDANSKKSATPKDYMQEFWREWQSQDPLKDLKDRGAGTGPRGTIIKELQESQKDLASAQDGQTRRTIGFGEGLDRVNSKIAKTGGALESFISGLKKGGLATAMGGGAGLMVGKVMGWAEDQANVYRQVLASGEGTVTSWQEFSTAAARATMSTEELADAMTKGSEATRKFGALKWAALSANLTKATQAAGNMGMNFEMRQEAQDTFLDIIGKQGNLGKLDDAQMVNGIMQIAKNSADTAHILGITRTEALQAAKERANDHNLNAIIRTMGYNNNSINTSMDTMKAMAGPLGEKLMREVLASRGQGPTSKDTTTFAATNPEMLKFAQNLQKQMQGGGVLDATAVANQANGVAQTTRNAPGSMERAQIAILAQNLPSEIAGAFASSAQVADFQANATEREEGTGDAGTRAMLDLEQAHRASIAAMNQAINSLVNTTLTKYGEKLEEWTLKFIELLGKLNGWLEKLQGWPTLMSSVAIGLGGLLGGLTILTFTTKVLGGLFGGLGKIISGVLNIGGKLFGGGGGAAGAAGAAGRGAAGAAGGRAGGTILGNLMRGAGGALGKIVPGGVRDFAASRAGGMIKGGAGLGALLEAGGYIFGDKELTMKNLAKSGLRVGGGIAGGALGSLAGPLGTILGGAGGSMAGDALGNWIFGEDDVKKPANASKAPQTANPQQQAQRRAQQPANAANNKNKTTLTLDQMTNRVMDSSERAAGYLKVMKDQGEKTHELMREEIVVLRTMTDRMSRLLEEGNKNTRSISEHLV